MNYYEDAESITAKFPSMATFISEEFMTMNAFPEGMVDAFREELDKDGNRERMQLALTGYMVEQYHRQCEPLMRVAQGFQSILEHLPPGVDFKGLVYHYLMNAHANEGNIPPWTVALSNIVQGPSFTRAAFDALMNRCEISHNTSVAMRKSVRKRMRVIRNWYLSNAATDAQRKRLLRCMNGTDVIIVGMRSLKFGEPATRSNYTLDPYSRFHTCMGSVDLGTNLMRLDPEANDEFINTWLNHIEEAMQGGISMR